MKPAMMTTGDLTKIKRPIIKNCPKAPKRKPSVTAFGEPNANIAATSIPGTAPGSKVFEIPVKLSVNYETKVRTPSCKIARLTANCSDVVMI